MVVRDISPGRVAKALTPHIAVLTVWSVVALVIHTLSHHPGDWGLEDSALTRLTAVLQWSDQGIPFGAIGALGSALAIFLGFRNNSAYDRWWEARKIWGALVNESRSWCRQVVAWAQAPDDAEDPQQAVAELRRRLVHRHLAFVHGLALHLRKQPQLLETVARFVPEDEAERYATVPNVPTALLIEQGRAVADARERGGIEHFRHLAMDDLLTRLSDIQGKCERIKNTPIPRQYDAFPRWFVYFYAAILPFALVGTTGWGAIPLSVGITILFLALEASGRYIENPFENARLDTPMTALAVTIERDLRAALGEPLPDAIVPDEMGVLM